MAEKIADLEVQYSSKGYDQVRKEVDQLEKGLKDADQAAEKLGDDSVEVGEKAGGAFAGFGSEISNLAGAVPGLGGAISALTGPLGIVTAAFVGLTVGIGSAIEGVADLEKELRPLAARAGTTVESLHALGTIGNLIGAENDDAFDSISDQILVFNERLQDAKLQLDLTGEASGPVAEIFEQIGLNVEDFINLSPEQAWRRMRDELSELDSTGQRMYITTELMGGAGERTAEIFNLTSQQFAEAEERARQYGGVMSFELTESIKAYNIEKARMGGLMQTVSNAIAGAFVPALTWMSDKLADSIEWIIDAVRWTGALIDVFRDFAALNERHSQWGFFGDVAAFAQLGGEIGNLVDAHQQAERATDQHARAQRQAELDSRNLTLGLSDQSDKVRDLTRSYHDARQALEESFGDSLGRANRIFSRSQEDALREYNRRITKQNESYHEDILEQQERYYKDMEESSLDHRRRMADILERSQSDIEKAERDHLDRMQQLRLNEQHSIEDADTSLKRRISDIERDFQRDREEAFQEIGHDTPRFNIRVAELEEERNERLEDARTGHRRRLEDIETDADRREDEAVKRKEERIRGEEGLLAQRQQQQEAERQRYRDELIETEQNHLGRLEEMEERHQKWLAEQQEEFEYRKQIAQERHNRNLSDMWENYYKRLEDLEKQHQGRMADLLEQGFASREGAYRSHHQAVESEVERHLEAVRSAYNQMVDDMGWERDGEGGFPLIFATPPPGGPGSSSRQEVPLPLPVDIQNPLPVPVSGPGGASPAPVWSGSGTGGGGTPGSFAELGSWLSRGGLIPGADRPPVVVAPEMELDTNVLNDPLIVDFSRPAEVVFNQPITVRLDAPIGLNVTVEAATTTQSVGQTSTVTGAADITQSVLEAVGQTSTVTGAADITQSVLEAVGSAIPSAERRSAIPAWRPQQEGGSGQQGQLAGGGASTVSGRNILLTDEDVERFQQQVRAWEEERDRERQQQFSLQASLGYAHHPGSFAVAPIFAPQQPPGGGLGGAMAGVGDIPIAITNMTDFIPMVVSAVWHNISEQVRSTSPSQPWMSSAPGRIDLQENRFELQHTDSEATRLHDQIPGQLRRSDRPLELVQYQAQNVPLVNQYLRGFMQGMPDEQFYAEQTQAIVDAMQPLQQPLIVYRGAQDVGNLYPQQEWGRFTEPGFSSTSTYPDTSLGFGNYQVLLQIEVPEGLPAIVMESAEQEVLLPPGLEFKVWEIIRNMSVQGLREWDQYDVGRFMRATIPQPEQQIESNPWFSASAGMSSQQQYDDDPNLYRSQMFDQHVRRHDYRNEYDLSEVVQSYIRMGYNHLNRFMRGFDPDQLMSSRRLMDSDFVRQSRNAAVMQNEMMPLATDTTLFRGVNSYIDPNQDWIDQAFSSTSTNVGRPMYFSGDRNILQIEAPAGTPSIVTNAPEQEVILASGLPMEILEHIEQPDIEFFNDQGQSRSRQVNNLFVVRPRLDVPSDERYPWVNYEPPADLAHLPWMAASTGVDPLRRIWHGGGSAMDRDVAIADLRTPLFGSIQRDVGRHFAKENMGSVLELELTRPYYDIAEIQPGDELYDRLVDIGQAWTTRDSFLLEAADRHGGAIRSPDTVGEMAAILERSTEFRDSLFTEPRQEDVQEIVISQPERWISRIADMQPWQYVPMQAQEPEQTSGLVERMMELSLQLEQMDQQWEEMFARDEIDEARRFELEQMGPLGDQISNLQQRLGFTSWTDETPNIFRQEFTPQQQREFFRQRPQFEAPPWLSASTGRSLKFPGEYGLGLATDQFWHGSSRLLEGGLRDPFFMSPSFRTAEQYADMARGRDRPGLTDQWVEGSLTDEEYEQIYEQTRGAVQGYRTRLPAWEYPDIAYEDPARSMEIMREGGKLLTETDWSGFSNMIAEWGRSRDLDAFRFPDTNQRRADLFELVVLNPERVIIEQTGSITLPDLNALSGDFVGPSVSGAPLYSRDADRYEQTVRGLQHDPAQSPWLASSTGLSPSYPTELWDRPGSTVFHTSRQQLPYDVGQYYDRFFTAEDIWTADYYGVGGHLGYVPEPQTMGFRTEQPYRDYPNLRHDQPDLWDEFFAMMRRGDFAAGDDMVYNWMLESGTDAMSIPHRDLYAQTVEDRYDRYADYGQLLVARPENVLTPIGSLAAPHPEGLHGLTQGLAERFRRDPFHPESPLAPQVRPLPGSPWQAASTGAQPDMERFYHATGQWHEGQQMDVYDRFHEGSFFSPDVGLAARYMGRQPRMYEVGIPTVGVGHADVRDMPGWTALLEAARAGAMPWADWDEAIRGWGEREGADVVWGPDTFPAEQRLGRTQHEEAQIITPEIIDILNVWDAKNRAAGWTGDWERIQGRGAASPWSAISTGQMPRGRDIVTGGGDAILSREFTNLPEFRSIDRLSESAQEYIMDSGGINTYLRREGQAAIAYEQYEIDTFDRMMREMLADMRPLERDTMVYRGMGGPRVEYDPDQPAYTDRGFLSTSISPTEAAGFSSGLGSPQVMQIPVPAGTPAIVTNEAEREVVLPPGLQMDMLGRVPGQQLDYEGVFPIGELFRMQIRPGQEGLDFTPSFMRGLHDATQTTAPPILPGFPQGQPDIADMTGAQLEARGRELADQLQATQNWAWPGPGEPASEDMEQAYLAIESELQRYRDAYSAMMGPQAAAAMPWMAASTGPAGVRPGSEAFIEQMRPSYGRDERGDPYLRDFANWRWGGQQAQVVSGREFDRIPSPPMLRGITRRGDLQSELEGDFYSTGAFGSGLYFGYGPDLQLGQRYTDALDVFSNQDIAEGQMRGWMYGAKLDPDASVMDLGRFLTDNEITDQPHQHLMDATGMSDTMMQFLGDMGRAGAYMGYDALDASAPGVNYGVALNRNRLLVDERTLPGGEFHQDVDPTPLFDPIEAILQIQQESDRAFQNQRSRLRQGQDTRGVVDPLRNLLGDIETRQDWTLDANEYFRRVGETYPQRTPDRQLTGASSPWSAAATGAPPIELWHGQRAGRPQIEEFYPGSFFTRDRERALRYAEGNRLYRVQVPGDIRQADFGFSEEMEPEFERATETHMWAGYDSAMRSYGRQEGAGLVWGPDTGDELDYAESQAEAVVLDPKDITILEVFGKQIIDAVGRTDWRPIGEKPYDWISEEQSNLTPERTNLIQDTMRQLQERNQYFDSLNEIYESGTLFEEGNLEFARGFDQVDDSLNEMIAQLGLDIEYDPRGPHELTLEKQSREGVGNLFWQVLDDEQRRPVLEEFPELRPPSRETQPTMPWSPASTGRRGYHATFDELPGVQQLGGIFLADRPEIARGFAGEELLPSRLGQYLASPEGLEARPDEAGQMLEDLMERLRIYEFELQRPFGSYPDIATTESADAFRRAGQREVPDYAARHQILAQEAARSPMGAVRAGDDAGWMKRMAGLSGQEMYVADPASVIAGQVAVSPWMQASTGLLHGTGQELPPIERMTDPLFTSQHRPIADFFAQRSVNRMGEGDPRVYGFDAQVPVAQIPHIKEFHDIMKDLIEIPRRWGQVEEYLARRDDVLIRGVGTVEERTGIPAMRVHDQTRQLRRIMGDAGQYVPEPEEIVVGRPDQFLTPTSPWQQASTGSQQPFGWDLFGQGMAIPDYADQDEFSVRQLPDFRDDAGPGLQRWTRAYFDSAYESINNWLRGRRAGTAGEDTMQGLFNIPEAVEQIMSDMRPLQQPLRAYRGLVSSEELEEGQIFSDPAFMSASTMPRTGISFARGPSTPSGTRDTLLQLDVPQGHPAVVSNMPESEVLLPPGLEWQVQDVQRPVQLTRQQDERFGPIPFRQVARMTPAASPWSASNTGAPSEMWRGVPSQQGMISQFDPRTFWSPDSGVAAAYTARPGPGQVYQASMDPQAAVADFREMPGYSDLLEEMRELIRIGGDWLGYNQQMAEWGEDRGAQMVIGADTGMDRIAQSIASPFSTTPEYQVLDPSILDITGMWEDHTRRPGDTWLPGIHPAPQMDIMTRMWPTPEEDDPQVQMIRQIYEGLRPEQIEMIRTMSGLDESEVPPWTSSSTGMRPSRDRRISVMADAVLSPDRQPSRGTMWGSQAGLLQEFMRRLYPPQQMQVVSGAEFDAIPSPPMLRGVTQEQFVDSDMAGQFMGEGLFGSGLYYGMGKDVDTGLSFMDLGLQQGAIYGAKMSPEAQVMGPEELRAITEQRPSSRGVPGLRPTRDYSAMPYIGSALQDDLGLAMAFEGWDAYRTPRDDYVVAQNRQQIVVDERTLPGGEIGQQVGEAVADALRRGLDFEDDPMSFIAMMGRGREQIGGILAPTYGPEGTAQPAALPPWTQVSTGRAGASPRLPGGPNATPFGAAREGFSHELWGMFGELFNVVRDQISGEIQYYEDQQGQVMRYTPEGIVQASHVDPANIITTEGWTLELAKSLRAEQQGAATPPPAAETPDAFGTVMGGLAELHNRGMPFGAGRIGGGLGLIPSRGEVGLPDLPTLQFDEAPTVQIEDIGPLEVEDIPPIQIEIAPIIVQVQIGDQVVDIAVPAPTPTTAPVGQPTAETPTLPGEVPTEEPTVPIYPGTPPVEVDILPPGFDRSAPETAPTETVPPAVGTGVAPPISIPAPTPTPIFPGVESGGEVDIIGEEERDIIEDFAREGFAPHPPVEAPEYDIPPIGTFDRPRPAPTPRRPIEVDIIGEDEGSIIEDFAGRGFAIRPPIEAPDYTIPPEREFGRPTPTPRRPFDLPIGWDDDVVGEGEDQILDDFLGGRLPRTVEAPRRSVDVQYDDELGLEGEADIGLDTGRLEMPGPYGVPDSGTFGRPIPDEIPRFFPQPRPDISYDEEVLEGEVDIGTDTGRLVVPDYSVPQPGEFGRPIPDEIPRFFPQPRGIVDYGDDMLEGEVDVGTDTGRLTVPDYGVPDVGTFGRPIPDEIPRFMPQPVPRISYDDEEMLEEGQIGLDTGRLPHIVPYSLPEKRQFGRPIGPEVPRLMPQPAPWLGPSQRELEDTFLPPEVYGEYGSALMDRYLHPGTAPPTIRPIGAAELRGATPQEADAMLLDLPRRPITTVEEYEFQLFGDEEEFMPEGGGLFDLETEPEYVPPRPQDMGRPDVHRPLPVDPFDLTFEEEMYLNLMGPEFTVPDYVPPRIGTFGRPDATRPTPTESGPTFEEEMGLGRWGLEEYGPFDYVPPAPAPVPPRRLPSSEPDPIMDLDPSIYLPPRRTVPRAVRPDTPRLMPQAAPWLMGSDAGDQPSTTMLRPWDDREDRRDVRVGSPGEPPAPSSPWAQISIGDAAGQQYLRALNWMEGEGRGRADPVRDVVTRVAQHDITTMLPSGFDTSPLDVWRRVAGSEAGGGQHPLQHTLTSPGGPTFESAVREGIPDLEASDQAVLDAMYPFRQTITHPGGVSTAPDDDWDMLSEFEWTTMPTEREVRDRRLAEEADTSNRFFESLLTAESSLIDAVPSAAISSAAETIRSMAPSLGEATLGAFGVEGIAEWALGPDIPLPTPTPGQTGPITGPGGLAEQFGRARSTISGTGQPTTPTTTILDWARGMEGVGPTTGAQAPAIDPATGAIVPLPPNVLARLGATAEQPPVRSSTPPTMRERAEQMLAGERPIPEGLSLEQLRTVQQVLEMEDRIQEDDAANRRVQAEARFLTAGNPIGPFGQYIDDVEELEWLEQTMEWREWEQRRDLWPGEEPPTPIGDIGPDVWEWGDDPGFREFDISAEQFSSYREPRMPNIGDADQWRGQDEPMGHLPAPSGDVPYPDVPGTRGHEINRRIRERREQDLQNLTGGGGITTGRRGDPSLGDFASEAALVGDFATGGYGGWDPYGPTGAPLTESELQRSRQMATSSLLTVGGLVLGGMPVPGLGGAIPAVTRAARPALQAGRSAVQTGIRTGARWAQGARQGLWNVIDEVGAGVGAGMAGMLPFGMELTPAPIGPEPVGTIPMWPQPTFHTGQDMMDEPWQPRFNLDERQLLDTPALYPSQKQVAESSERNYDDILDGEDEYYQTMGEMGEDFTHTQTRQQQERHDIFQNKMMEEYGLREEQATQHQQYMQRMEWEEGQKLVRNNIDWWNEQHDVQQEGQEEQQKARTESYEEQDALLNDFLSGETAAYSQAGRDKIEAESTFQGDMRTARSNEHSSNTAQLEELMYGEDDSELGIYNIAGTNKVSSETTFQSNLRTARGTEHTSNKAQLAEFMYGEDDSELSVYNTAGANKVGAESTFQGNLRSARSAEHTANTAQLAAFMYGGGGEGEGEKEGEGEGTELGVYSKAGTAKVGAESTFQGNLRSARETEHPANTAQLAKFLYGEEGSELAEQKKGTDKRIVEEGRFFTESATLVDTKGRPVIEKQTAHANAQIKIVRDAINAIKNDLASLPSAPSRPSGGGSGDGSEHDAGDQGPPPGGGGGSGGGGGGGSGTQSVGTGVTFSAHQGGYVARGPVYAELHSNEFVIPLDRWDDIVQRMEASNNSTIHNADHLTINVPITLVVKEGSNLNANEIIGEARWQIERGVRSALQDAQGRGDRNIRSR